MKLRIATRQSALALWQANHVAARLRDIDGVDEVGLVPLSTRGDEVLDRSLQKIGGKGLFIKELEIAMQDRRADIAVHSMKDVPAEMPDGFVIGALLERANSADALVGATPGSIAPGARIGSSSLRRKAQLHRMFEGISVEPLRGNVNTRLGKLDDGEFDAIVLAAAGLERLGFEDRIDHAFTPEQMLPAASQGVIGIECREDNDTLRRILATLNDPDAVRTTAAERTIAARLDAGCHAPLATFAQIDGDALNVTAFVALPDGSEHLRESLDGAADDAAVLGDALADILIEKGARELLERAESEHD